MTYLYPGDLRRPRGDLLLDLENDLRRGGGDLRPRGERDLDLENDLGDLEYDLR